MINVAGHLREQNGTYQMILSWKDTNGKRRTKSISTGLPIKGNKKRAEALLRQTQKEFNPETMQQVCDLPVSEYFTRWRKCDEPFSRNLWQICLRYGHGHHAILIVVSCNCFSFR